MGFPLFLLSFFLVSHLLIVHSSGSCSSCGPFGPIKFPFTNDTNPDCRLFTVSCDEQFPRVILGGRPYQVSSITNDTIEINDPDLLLSLNESNYCDFFNYVNPLMTLSTPSISFTIFPNFTFFKCDNSSPGLEQEAREHFHYNENPKRCEGGYTVYYSKEPYDPSPPPNCQLFQLPVVDGDFTSGDLFTFLTSNFSVQYHVSKECLRDPEEFQCLHERGGRKKLALILGTVVGGVILLSCLLLIIWYRKKWRSYTSSYTIWSESNVLWKKKTESYRNIEAFLKNCGSLSPKRYTYSDIKKITNSFRTILGQGGFGCVFKGKLENDCLVAVKVLKGLKGNGEDFINEVATISRTSHVNIVTLLGFCFEGRHRALIYEFMPNGSLDKFIHDGDSSTYRQLGWEALYQIVIGIARGLEYLHRGCNTRILHFDIKPHNILLNEDFCPKISDFGLAKLCLQKESIISLTGTRGTVGYIAPEVFSRHFGGVSHKSDVYSYGMMVLEMVGVRKYNSAEVDHSSEVYFPHWVYKRLELDEEFGLHGNMDDEANASARKMIIVALWCIQTDPSHRPSMSRVVEMLEGSLESLQIPPKPFFSSPSRSHVEYSSSTLTS